MPRLHGVDDGKSLVYECKRSRRFTIVNREFERPGQQAIHDRTPWTETETVVGIKVFTTVNRYFFVSDLSQGILICGLPRGRIRIPKLHSV